MSSLLLLIANTTLTDGSTPRLFTISMYLPVFVLLTVTYLFVKRARHAYKKIDYDYQSLLGDIILVLVTLALCITSFQIHYLIWYIPLLLLLIPYSTKLYSFMCAFTVVSSLLALKSELGFKTFFINLGLNIQPLFLESTSSVVINVTNIVLFILIFALGIYLAKCVYTVHDGADNYNTVYYFILCFFLWSAILAVHIQHIMAYTDDEIGGHRHYNHLGSVRDYYKGTLYGDAVIFSDIGEKNSLVLKEVADSNNHKIKRDLFLATVYESRNDPQLTNKIDLMYIKFNNCILDSYKPPHLEKKVGMEIKIPLECLQKDKNVMFLDLTTPTSGNLPTHFTMKIENLNLSDYSIRAGVLPPHIPVAVGACYMLVMFAMILYAIKYVSNVPVET